MDRHSKNAIEICQFLKSHAKVAKLHFPWLKGQPYHELANKQTKAPSGMLSFDLDGSYDDVKKFFARLKVFTLAESLGGVESLANLADEIVMSSRAHKQLLKVEKNKLTSHVQGRISQCNRFFVDHIQ